MKCGRIVRIVSHKILYIVQIVIGAVGATVNGVELMNGVVV